MRQREIAKQINPEMKNIRINLPVFQYKQQIVEAIDSHPVCLIKGATGCGKVVWISKNYSDDVLSLHKYVNTCWNIMLITDAVGISIVSSHNHDEFLLLP